MTIVAFFRQHPHLLTLLFVVAVALTVLAAAQFAGVCRMSERERKRAELRRSLEKARGDTEDWEQVRRKRG